MVRSEEVGSYSWVLRGKQRTAIMLAMDKPKTPKQISVQTHIKFSNVSGVLRAMVDQGLMICLNPEERMGRLYQLTSLGKRIRKEL